MSIDQYVCNINQIDKEIADLEKKLADEFKNEANYIKKINDIKKSISKNTSISTYNSKMSQIQRYQSELTKISLKKAELNKKIADKRRKRIDAFQKLQKEQINETKKIEQQQQQIYKSYETEIKNLTSQVSKLSSISSDTNHHLYLEDGNEEYDVFISHAFEDKESFANDLYASLEEEGIKVWYDDLCISWGDSLRLKIDNGLKKSKYGIVILSNNFIKKGWTQYEVDGLFQREMSGGKIILPIWHNISKKEVQDFSPTLANRMALNSAIMTPKEIAEELIKILKLNK